MRTEMFDMHKQKVSFHYGRGQGNYKKTLIQTSITNSKQLQTLS